VFYLIVTAEEKHMSSTNNNDYDYTEREKKVLELYDQGKSTRDIAKDLRMSLRDISIIFRKNQASHGNVITNDNDNRKNKTTKPIPESRSLVVSIFLDTWYA
jgi:DNA invertase Pin-like site-specific DNA recombinase